MDEYLSRLRGLWTAELELPSERARLPRLPPWVGEEVTQDPRYSNVRLVLAGPNFKIQTAKPRRAK